MSSDHWCRGVLEQVQANNPVQNSYSQSQYPYLQAYSTSPYGAPPPPAAAASQPPPPSQPPPQANGNAASSLSPNDYYRQYCDYYTRYYYGQTQQQTALITPAPPSAPPQAPPAVPTPTLTPSQPTYTLPSTYTPPSTANAQTNYTSTPVSYAAAVLKGQSSFPLPAAATSAQPSRKPNPSRFAPAPPAPSTSAPPPPPPSAPSSTSYSPYSSTPSPQPQPSAPAKPNNNSSPPVSPWPPSLKTFVEKSFAQCETDADRSFIEDKLKSLISKVTNDGRMHKHRWDLEPIAVPPSQLPAIAIPESTPQGSKDEAREPRRKKSRFQPIEETPPQGNLSLTSSGNQGSRIVPAKVTSKEEINRQNRANRFMREHNLQQQPQQPQSQSQQSQKHQGKKRKSQHVNNNIKSSSSSAVSSSGSGTGTSGGYSDAELEALMVIGTCQKVEKDYFRLTSAPDPTTVRPLEVLKKALELVKERWSQFRRADATSGLEGGVGAGSGNGTTYIWLCSQLKSIRQDVMVQHIKNEFTVNVYELHGRIALQCDDLNEYNQCQTQLKQLYSNGHGQLSSEMEFTAYRILYYLYLQGNSKYQKGNQDLAHIMSSLTSQAMSDPAVDHALQLRKAISLDNYHRCFHLFKSTPNLGRYILVKMMDSWRMKALQRMVKTYRPTLEVEFILSELSYDSSETSQGMDFIRRVGGIIRTKEDGVEILDPMASVISATVVTQDDQLLL